VYKKEKSEMSDKVLTVQQADLVLDQLEARKAQFCGMLAELGARLSEAEANLGEAVLEGDESAARTVADLRLKVDSINAGLRACEKRKAAAAVDRRRAEAAAIRHQAEVKRANLADLEKKTAKLLNDLSELENVTYTRAVLCAQRTPGSWEPAVTATIRDINYLSPAEVIRYLASYDPYAVPRSRQLFVAIQELENQAAKIDSELAAGPVEAPPTLGLKTVYAPFPATVAPEDQFRERPDWR
jgi:hypothetical protein